jgi:hypothetical protein
MTGQAPSITACQGRSVIAAADLFQTQADAAEQIRAEVQAGLRQFHDSFLDALGGDFLAEADERRLRDKFRNQPAALGPLLARNRRCLDAQRALHTLYNKLQAGAAMSLEERALAEHAGDLCQGYAQRQFERRSLAAGL